MMRAIGQPWRRRRRRRNNNNNNNNNNKLVAEEEEECHARKRAWPCSNDTKPLQSVWRVSIFEQQRFRCKSQGRSKLAQRRSKNIAMTCDQLPITQIVFSVSVLFLASLSLSSSSLSMLQKVLWPAFFHVLSPDCTELFTNLWTQNRNSLFL